MLYQCLVYSRLRTSSVGGAQARRSKPGPLLLHTMCMSLWLGAETPVAPIFMVSSPLSFSSFGSTVVAVST